MELKKVERCMRNGKQSYKLTGDTDYKNAHFADFDPMAEFTLDW